MFRETVTHAGGSTQGAAKESHALMLLRRARNRSCAMEATRTGGARISWGRVNATTRATEVRAIVLDPELPVGDLDERTRAILALVGVGGARHVLDVDRRYILAAGTEIPSGESARLRASRLVAVGSQGRVRLTLAARLGLLAHDHIQAGGAADGFAMCSCGFTASAPTGESAAQRSRRVRGFSNATRPEPTCLRGWGEGFGGRFSCRQPCLR
ncbi:hypothetical protein AB0N14_17720 [Streptomyces sp. NPDC051104]|uniref:hypothetical protein n=1 Tax=Streptomyces sp. NPDC051104 TaxID=3155044 RepID=UPI00342A3A15